MTRRRPDPYAPHAGFVAPARASCQLWRLVAGFLLASVAYVLLVRLFVLGVELLGRLLAPGQFTGIGRGDTPAEVLVLLFSFVFMAAGAGISARVLHRRGFASLLGAGAALRRDFGRVSLAVLAVGLAVLILPPWDMGGDLVPNLAPGRWLLLLGPALVAVLIQVSAEEIVFRGYVQQQLAARFRSPLIWMVLPSVLFAWGHYQPAAAGENALLIALWSGVFGMLMADLTARSGSLGPAIAVHFWNNVSAILIVSLPDGLSGLALYLSPFSMEDAQALRDWVYVDFAMMIVLWLTARLAIRR